MPTETTIFISLCSLYNSYGLLIGSRVRGQRGTALLRQRSRRDQRYGSPAADAGADRTQLHAAGRPVHHTARPPAVAADRTPGVPNRRAGTRRTHRRVVPNGPLNPATQNGNGVQKAGKIDDPLAKAGRLGAARNKTNAGAAVHAEAARTALPPECRHLQTSQGTATAAGTAAEREGSAAEGNQPGEGADLPHRGQAAGGEGEEGGGGEAGEVGGGGEGEAGESEAEGGQGCQSGTLHRHPPRLPRETRQVILCFITLVDNSNMRKGSRGTDQADHDGDEQLQSRMGIKKKLGNFLSEDFNLSRFSESRSEHSKVSSLFPQLNDPTLEIKELEFSKIDDQLEKYYPEGPTARLSPARQPHFHEELETVSQQLEEKEAEVKTLRKKYEQSQRDLERARRETSAKDELIQRQRDEIEELRGKRSTAESRESGSNRSLMEESIHNFCPELLSPEETVQLLSSLLQKVTRSSKMVKSLTSNARTRDILAKITRADHP